MAKFDQGRFVAHESYTCDDMEVYPIGPIALLDQSFSSSNEFYFEDGSLVILTSNYASDDFEAEALGAIAQLRNGARNGDCLFKTGKFH